MTEAPRQAGATARELMSFHAAGQEFCLDVATIREIRGWTATTPLPQSPAFVRGVINLRGTVLPVVDLAGRLGFANAEPTARHVIIVAQIGRRQIGLLVDAVCDILTVDEELIQPPPEVGSDLARAFVGGLFAVDGRMLTLISPDDILPAREREAA